MGNHYHLFIETPGGNLVDGMKWLQNTVTRRFNIRHRKWGRLFGDRYKAVLVEGEEAGYYSGLWDYIHLNPARAGMINWGKGESILDYPWSSIAGGYALMPGRRAKWLAAKEGLEIMGYVDTAGGRRRMVEHLDRRGREEGKASGIVEAAEGMDGRLSHLRRGWYWGTQKFAQKVLKVGEKVVFKGESRSYRESMERVAHGMEEADRLLQEGMFHSGLKAGDLGKIKASDPRKAALARIISRHTTARHGWLAGKLKMKSPANVGTILNRTQWDEVRKELPAGFRQWMKAEGKNV